MIHKLNSFYIMITVSFFGIEILERTDPIHSKIFCNGDSLVTSVPYNL